MAVNNGQPANQDTFNNAYISKTTDSTTVGEIDLNNANAASGTQVTNVQREHNSIASYVGKAINAIKDALPSWTSTAVGTASDDLTQRAEALTVASGVNAANIALKEDAANKGIANGYASLDGSGTVPLAELPDSVTGAREFKGQWVASTNTPTLADGDVENAGAEYNASDDGTVDFGSGNITFTQGDTVIYDGAVWSKIDGSVVRDLNDIRDVVETSTADGDHLRFDGTNWINFDPDQVADDAATGANVTLSAVDDLALVRLTAGTLTSVDMIPATTKAERFILVNDTGGDVDINNLTGATAANQIITGTGLDLTLADQAALFFVYDTTDTKWRIVGGSGGGGSFPLLAPDGSQGAPSYSFASNSGTGVYTSSGADLRFAVNSSEKFIIDANGDLEPSSTTQDLGSTTQYFAQAHSALFYAGNGTLRGAFRGGTSLSNPGSFANVQAYVQTQQQAGASLSIHSRDDFGVDAVKAGNLYLQGGRKINGTGDGGDVIAHMGSSAGGNRGNFAVDDGRTAEGSMLRPISSDGRLAYQKGPGGALFDGPDSDFEFDQQSWTEYFDAVQNTPEDGTGGSPNVTAAHTAVGGEVLNGNGSYKLSKDAANRQGQGWSLDKPCPIAFRGKSTRISFNYLGSANFDYGNISTDSDVTVWAYDITNSTLLPLNFNRLTGEGRFESDIFIPSACENIRFIFHVATTNAAAWDLIIDDFIPELVPFTSFNNMSDWVDAGAITIGATTSAPTKGTNSVDRVMYRYEGQDAIIRYDYVQSTVGTAGSGDYILEVPPEIGEIDSNFVNLFSAGLSTAGDKTDVTQNGTVVVVGTGSADVQAIPYSANELRVILDQRGVAAANTWGSAFFTFGNAALEFSITVRVPIVGRTSGAKHPAAIGLNAKAVMRAFKNGGGVTSNVTIPSWTTVEKDSLGGFNASTGEYTIKSPGDYHVSMHLQNSIVTTIAVRVNGAVRLIGDGASTRAGLSTILEDLNNGDIVTMTSGGTGTIAAADDRTVFAIHKIGSENQPYAPRVAYLYHQEASGTGGGSIAASYAARPVNVFEEDVSFISATNGTTGTGGTNNRFQLEPGTYDYDFEASFYGGTGPILNQAKLRLQNFTDATTVKVGKVSAAAADSGDTSVITIHLRGRVSISSTKEFEIQDRASTAVASSSARGIGTAFGDVNVHLEGKITKIL